MARPPSVNFTLYGKNIHGLLKPGFLEKVPGSQEISIFLENFNLLTSMGGPASYELVRDELVRTYVRTYVHTRLDVRTYEAGLL